MWYTRKQQRFYRRCNKRRFEKEYKRRSYGYGDPRCATCGGEMTWCSICQEWTMYCCSESGSCSCSYAYY